MVSTAFPSPALPAWRRSREPCRAQPPAKAGHGGRRRVLLDFAVMSILCVCFFSFTLLDPKRKARARGSSAAPRAGRGAAAAGLAAQVAAL